MIAGGSTLFFHSIQAIGDAAQRGLSNVKLLAWLAAGSATAIWLSILPGFQQRTVNSRLHE
jgi:hypothetical protein